MTQITEPRSQVAGLHPCGWMPWCVRPSASLEAARLSAELEYGPIFPLLARANCDERLRAALIRLWRRI